SRRFDAIAGALSSGITECGRGCAFRIERGSVTNAPVWIEFIQKNPEGIMRKLLGVCFAAMLLCGTALPQSAQNEPPLLTVIRAGSLIDGTSDAPRKNQMIFVRGKKIERIADASEAIPSDARVIDLSNATVLPGLIDSHTHIFLWG